MGRDRVFLAFLGVLLPGSDEDVAVLEDGRRVAKDEVDVALDAARFVVLPHAVCVKSVLIAEEFAIFYDGAIAVRSESYCLMSFGACCVLEGHVTRHESISKNSCREK